MAGIVVAPPPARRKHNTEAENYRKPWSDEEDERLRGLVAWRRWRRWRRCVVPLVVEVERVVIRVAHAGDGRASSRSRAGLAPAQAQDESINYFDQRS